jgi:colicin import membrane protein
MRSSFISEYCYSIMLHAAAIALFLFFTYEAQHRVKAAPKIFELVQGEGDNYAATEAPALGTAGGVSFSPPAQPPAPAPDAPPLPAAPPLEATPEPPAKPAPNAPNFAKTVKRIADKREANIEKKFHAEQERQAKEDALKAKRMTEEEFKKLNKGKAPPTSSATAPKVARIDVEGIAKGVEGGSTANKVGGGGGKAMTSEEGSAMDRYFSLLKQQMKTAFEQPPGLSDALVARVELTVTADGTLSGARISHSSGSAEFDRAVLDAITRIQMPPRPDHKNESIGFLFSMKEKDEG